MSARDRRNPIMTKDLSRRQRSETLVNEVDKPVNPSERQSRVHDINGVASEASAEVRAVRTDAHHKSWSSLTHSRCRFLLSLR